MPLRNTPYKFLPPLKRAKRGGAVQHIQDAVRDAIVRLEIAPGEYIDKKALCERLGVSRFPVSEALGRLADEGFVEIQPQHGTRVSLIDLADCREAMFMRRALESGVLRAITPAADKALIARLEDILNDQRAAMARDDRVRFHDGDLALHDTLLARLGYERVTSAVAGARAKLDRMRLFMCTPQRQAATFSEHRRIVDAVAAGDAVGAGEAMEAHLDMVLAEIAEFAAVRPDAFAASEYAAKSA
jgi:DNA-binding GntR family transcriptional regulator